MASKRKTPQTPAESAAPSPVAEHGMARLDLIDFDGENHRRSGKKWDLSVERMARSLKQNGQLEPILLYAKPDGRYLCGFGHRRVSGARHEMNKWDHIRAEVLPMPEDPTEIFDKRDRENLDHDTLTPLEEMYLVQHRLKLNGGNIEAAAARLDKDPSWVRARAFLDRLDHVVCEMLDECRLYPAHARELAKLTDKEAQRQIAREGGLREEGVGKLRPVAWFREKVESQRRSLKVLPWDGGKPFAGKPSCVGCPSNSQTNPTLFEISDSHYCMDGACYDAKAKAAGSYMAPVEKPKPSPLEKWKKSAAGRITAAAVGTPERWAALEALAIAWKVELPKKPEEAAK